jgi:hypothetical protein
MTNFVNIEGNFIAQFGTMKKDLEKVAQRILRKTANQTDKEVHRLVTANKLIDINLKDFRKTKTLIRHSDLKGGIDGMSITISITSKAHTSYRFFPSYVGVAKKKVWMGRIHGKAKRFYGGQAFSLPGKKPLFVRESTSRFPIKPVFGPTVSEMLDRGGHVPKLVSFSEESLRANLSKSIGDNLKI